METIENSSKFRVLVRVRPVLELSVFQGEDEVCTAHIDETRVRVGDKIHHCNGTYSLEACVGQAEAALDARKDFTLMAFGQTSAGKTFTIIEIMSSFLDKVIEFSRQTHMHLSYSAFELRGESTIDLLSEEGGMGNVRCLVREDADGKVHVGNCTTVPIDIDKKEHLQGLIDKTFSRRKTSATFANEASSRTHAFSLFTFRDSIIGNTFSIRLIDLAGCERWEDSLYHSQERITEMKAINYSLGCLKECARLMLANVTSTSTKVPHIPYRRSKLTMLLKDVFIDGGAAALVIAHLAPSRASLKHSENTMNFVASILEKETLAMKEKKSFSGPLAWSKEEMIAFVASLEGGRYAHLASSFSLTGKLFSVEWIGHVHRRAVAAGGTEAEGEAIYDAFHDLVARHKAASKSTRTVPVSSTRSSLSLTERRAMKAKFAASFTSDDVVVLARTKDRDESRKEKEM